MKTPQTRESDSQHFATSAGSKASSAANQSPASTAQRRLSTAVSNSPRQTAQRQFVQGIASRSTTQNTPSSVGTNILQRKGNSKGLTAAIKTASSGSKASEADYDILPAKGLTRAGQLNGVKPPVIVAANPPLRITDMTQENGMTITSHGSSMDDKERGNYVFKVESKVANATHNIAKYTNFFYLDSEYNIVGMKAADNFRSNEAADREVGANRFEFYMNEIIELQYAIVRKSAAAQKKKFFNSKRKMDDVEATDASLLTASSATDSPFYIVRTPTSGSQLARALLYAKQTNGITLTDRQLVALGSEHGSLAFNMCQSRGIALGRIEIKADIEEVSFSIR